MPTEMELTLEQTQQVLSDIEDSHGPSDAMHNPLPATQSQKDFVSKLTEIHSFLLTLSLRYDESNTYVLERFNTTAGNPVKKILLKLNLSDHSVKVLKLKKFQERCNIKAFQEWYEHVGPEVASPQDGKVTRWRRDCAWLMISSAHDHNRRYQNIWKMMSETENAQSEKRISDDIDRFRIAGGVVFVALDFISEVFVGGYSVRASVSDMPLSTYLNLGLGELADRTMKYPKGIAENVLVVLRERMELDLEVRLMGETLVINRSLDPLNGDYIELNDLNEPFELRRTQGDDFMPTIEKGEVIEEFRNKNDELDIEIDDYHSYCDYDKKIHIDCAHNLKFSCMIGFEFTYANFFPLLYVNVMSKEFHNSIMKDEMFLEDMDAYRDEGMGDVIFGEPFLREVGIKARRFEGMITIYNGNESVNDEDKKIEISRPYQKLKGFYKGVLNLGPDYIRDAKTE
ncbi:hypothetical protein Tco_1345459 [Tanacetum coccineum]